MELKACEPVALRICRGGINVLTGQADSSLLIKNTKSHIWPPTAQQNYVVLPAQRWISNFNAGNGSMSQFVASALDDTASLEAQLKSENEGPSSIRINAYPLLKTDCDVCLTPMLGESDVDIFKSPADVGLNDGDMVYLRSKRLPGMHPATLADHGVGAHTVLQLELVTNDCSDESPEDFSSVQEMQGFSGGGKITDQVYPDIALGPEKWDTDVEATAVVQLINSRAFTSSTGLPMPETEIREHDYKSIGLPAAYKQSWDEEPDSNGLHSLEVSELPCSRKTMFMSRSSHVCYELRK